MSIIISYDIIIDGGLKNDQYANTRSKEIHQHVPHAGITLTRGITMTEFKDRCIKCGSQEINKAGRIKSSNRYWKQKLKCQNCERNFFRPKLYLINQVKINEGLS